MPAEKEGNPDISEYVGRGDLNVIYAKNGNILSFIGSHNLNFDSKTRGNASFLPSYPIKNNLKGYLLVSHGYAETLIDLITCKLLLALGFH